MKMIIVAGGTGGHFYPGLSVAKKALSAGDTVSFVVRKKDFVIPLLEREKISFDTIHSAGLSRSLHPKNILTLIKIMIGFFQSLSIIRKQKPAVILAMGGYLSVPVAMAARFLGLPVVLHEQNVKPGLANRILSRLVNNVGLSFSASAKYFGKQSMLVGNPVREVFSSLPSRSDALKKWNLDRDKKTLLVFGGSLGAHRVNELIVEVLPEIEPHHSKIQAMHFTGEKDQEFVKEAYAKTKIKHVVSAFCHEMETAFAAADLILCRSGASTVAEILTVKKPAILVPYPYATGGHQTDNAKVISDVGAAILIEQKDLDGQKLKDLLENILLNESKQKEMTQKFSQVSWDGIQAAQKIHHLVQEAACK